MPVLRLISCFFSPVFIGFDTFFRTIYKDLIHPRWFFEKEFFHQHYFVFGEYHGENFQSVPFLCNQKRERVLGGSSQLVSGEDHPPFFSHGVRPSGRQTTTRSLGDLRSPWSLTTYKSWDDPPTIL